MKKSTQIQDILNTFIKKCKGLDKKYETHTEARFICLSIASVCHVLNNNILLTMGVDLAEEQINFFDKADVMFVKTVIGKLKAVDEQVANDLFEISNELVHSIGSITEEQDGTTSTTAIS